MTTHAANVTAQIAQLPTLPMENLWALWDEFFDRRPGHHHRTYLESRIAYKLQERVHGGLSAALRRRLEKIGETGEVPNQKRRAESQVAPGTVMVREFNGIDHRVTVLDDGRFEYQGRPYKSLTAVARALSGTTNYGHRFFCFKTYQHQPNNSGRLNRTRHVPPSRQNGAARSIPASPPMRGWTRNTTASRRNAMPPWRSSAASGTKAGSPSMTAMTMAASRAAT